MAVPVLLYTFFLYPIESCEGGDEKLDFRIHFPELSSYKINLDNKLIKHPSQKPQGHNSQHNQDIKDHHNIIIKNYNSIV